MKEVFYWQLRVYDYKTKGWRGSEEFASFDELVKKYGSWIASHPEKQIQIKTRKAFVSAYADTFAVQQD